MLITRIIQNIIQDPRKAYIKFLNRIDPKLLWHHYSKLVQKVGFTASKFVFSFDCDTEEDIKVVGDVHSRLVDMGVMPVYAVPGELLQRGERVYRRIFESGAEFINHGYKQHTIFQNNQYVSTLFYDKLTPDEVKADILAGDESLKNILGHSSNGFRTPHFGTFASPDDLEFLYSVLESLNYSYSTSTMPIEAFRRGTLFTTGKSFIKEIPLTGFFDYPFLLLDSWGLRYSPSRLFSEEIYKKQIEKFLNFMTQGNHIIINLYADPSQVYDWEDFFQSMKVLAPYNVSSYNHLIDQVNSNA